MSQNKITKYKVDFYNTLADIYPKQEIDAIYKMSLEHSLNKDYISIHLEPDIIIPNSNWNTLLDILLRLSKNEPIQHIIGKADFYDLAFEVNSNVLIPRQETELLIHILIERLKIFSSPDILDIGTGSGCIAISLKKNIYNASISALDISKDALAIAKKNARLNNLEITFMQHDILNPDLDLQGKYDLIVSNPPYVRLSEKKLMHPNVINFDPALALYVTDDDPLIFYRTITEFSIKNLNQGGLLAFEINEAFGEQTLALISDNEFKNAELIKDLNNKYRFIIATKK